MYRGIVTLINKHRGLNKYRAHLNIRPILRYWPDCIFRRWKFTENGCHLYWRKAKCAVHYGRNSFVNLTNNVACCSTRTEWCVRSEGLHHCRRVYMDEYGRRVELYIITKHHCPILTLSHTTGTHTIQSD